MHLIAWHAEETYISVEFPVFTSTLFDKAMAAGYGREEVSAVFKVLARDAGKGQ